MAFLLILFYTIFVDNVQSSIKLKYVLDGNSTFQPSNKVGHAQP